MLTPQTMTIYANGRAIPLGEVRPRDLVMSYRCGSGTLGSAEVTRREDGQVGKVYRVTTRDGGRLECSAEESILRFGRAGRRFVPVTKINHGDTLPRFVDGIRTLTNVIAIETEDMKALVSVHRLALSRPGNGYYADGFVVRG